MKDLIVLVADKNMEFLLKGLLPRIPAIENIRQFTYEAFVHPYHDPGIYNDADDFLRPLTDKYLYALVILDHSGCGHEEIDREQIEEGIEAKLNQSGWQDRACTIVINPELENWIWVNEIRMREAISWDKEINIYNWLEQNNWKEEAALKPHLPKESFEAILKLCRTPRSSSIYQEIASRASYKNCQDPAFKKMIAKIINWFSS